MGRSLPLNSNFINFKLHHRPRWWWSAAEERKGEMIAVCKRLWQHRSPVTRATILYTEDGPLQSARCSGWAADQLDGGHTCARRTPFHVRETPLPAPSSGKGSFDDCPTLRKRRWRCSDTKSKVFMIVQVRKFSWKEGRHYELECRIFPSFVDYKKVINYRKKAEIV